MINKYSLYYSYKTIGDVLLVDIIPDAVPTDSKRINDVEIIYDNNKVIGYNIFNISRIIKIKMTGILYHPENILIDIINSILSNAKQDTLDYVKESGFVVGEVKECIDAVNGYIAMIDIKNRMVTAFTKQEIAKDKKVVVAKAGTTLRNGRDFNEIVNEYGIFDAYICSGREVFFDDTYPPLILDDDIETGIDFFKIEVK